VKELPSFMLVGLNLIFQLRKHKLSLQIMKNLYAIKILVSLTLTLFLQKLQAQTSLTVSIIEQTQVCNMDGSVTLGIQGGAAPYTSHWLKYGPTQQLDTVLSSTSNPVTGLNAGYYVIHVYDVNGLFGSSGAFLQPPFNLFANITPATCSNSDGKIVAIVNDDASPFTFEWSTGAIVTSINNRDSIENLPAGPYELLVTNADGCVASVGEAGTSNPNQGIAVWATSPITSTSSSTPSNCFDGTATVVPANGTEPYSFYWNTNPVQTSSTATNLSPGFYQCLITDAEGCQRQAFVSVQAGPNFLQVNSSQINTVCNQATGSISVSVTGGAPPYTYVWSNGQTTASISGLAYGAYQLQITDNAGCSITVNKFIGNANPIQLTFTGTSPTCNQADGSVNLAISGGTAPFDILWSNGQTNTFVSNLPVGNVSVSVTDANGCVASGFYHLPISSACLATLSGRILADHNEDCITQTTEPGIAGVVVRAGSNYSLSQPNGNYAVQVVPGDYEITQYPPALFEQLCPENNDGIVVSAPNQATNYGGNNFFNLSEEIFSDVAVYLSSGPIRPGFQATYYITVKNLGVTATTPTLSFTHDALLDYLFASPNATNYTEANRTATWNVGLLAPNQVKHYQVRLSVSLDALEFLGETIPAQASVTLVAATDLNPDNNSANYERVITGSYDPNDKQVDPKGVGEDGRITVADTLLRYLIRFQNTGNDTAFTVVIRDTLDANLDVTTLKIEGFSHPMEVDLSGEGNLTFTFNNILLPDSNINEPASHGYIEYTIELKSNLEIGSQILNTAYIYFDFNPPIITNTTVNTLFDFTVSLGRKDAFDALIFPNPNEGNFALKLNLTQSELIVVELFDIAGRVIYTNSIGRVNSGESNLIFDLNDVRAGLYVLRVRAGNSEVHRPLIIH